MKKYIISAFAGLALMTSCVDLDLNPLSEGSSENWFSTEQEVTLALNALYNPALWKVECNRFFNTDRWTDDWNQRTQLYDWVGGTIDSGWSQGAAEWTNGYKGIARANTILYSLEKAAGEISEEKMAQYAGEAKFFRASFYTYLITAFGDVPFYTEYITLDQAYEMGRIDREVILQQIYADYDEAARVLPESYTGVERVTKGAALAMKARAALYMSDWKTCAEAAKACMDLGVYSLHPDFGEFFLSKTKTSPELIFALPCSNELGIMLYDAAGVNSFYIRNAGGTSVAQPSWELFFAFTCTDGLNVEDSPLYDPANPFANRDPRLAATTVEFGSAFLDYIYDELAYRIVKKMSGIAIAAILASPATSSANAPAVAVLTQALGAGTIASAEALLSAEATDNVAIMNRATWGTLKNIPVTSGQNVGDVFDGLPVVFTDALPSFASASANAAYMIVGDLKGVTANFPNGDDIKYKFDDTTEMTSDVIRVLGKLFGAIGVTAPFRFTQVKKAA